MYYTKAERYGLTTWSIILFLLTIAITSVQSRLNNRNASAHWKKVQLVIDSLQQQKESPTSSMEEVQMHQFMPNKIDSSGLVDLGLPAHIAGRWIRFRNAKKGFDGPADIKAIYGIPGNWLNKASPYMQWEYSDHPKPSQVQKRDSTPSTTRISYSSPTSSPTKPININTAQKEDFIALGFPSFIAHRVIQFREKVRPFSSVEELKAIYDIDTHMVHALQDQMYVDVKDLPKVYMNQAEVEQWKSLKGIGPVFAKRIVTYRDQLGGFVRKDQLDEVYGIEPELWQSLSDQLYIDTSFIRKIRINHASVQEIAAHPYLGWREADLILTYRKQHGSIPHISACKAFGPEIINKLQPYLSYD